MADNLLEQNKHFFPEIGPLNNSTAVSFGKKDSIVDLAKVNDAFKSDKKFIVTKNAVINRELVKSDLKHNDLQSTKVMINITQNNSKGQEVDVIEFKSAAEGGDMFYFNVKHQFATPTSADSYELHYKHKDSKGNVIDSYDADRNSDVKTFSDKVKNFFHLQNPADSAHVLSPEAQKDINWLNDLVGKTAAFDPVFAQEA